MPEAGQGCLLRRWNHSHHHREAVLPSVTSTYPRPGFPPSHKSSLTPVGAHSLPSCLEMPSTVLGLAEENWNFHSTYWDRHSQGVDSLAVHFPATPVEGHLPTDAVAIDYPVDDPSLHCSQAEVEVRQRGRSKARRAFWSLVVTTIRVWTLEVSHPAPASEEDRLPDRIHCSFHDQESWTVHLVVDTWLPEEEESHVLPTNGAAAAGEVAEDSHIDPHATYSLTGVPWEVLRVHKGVVDTDLGGAFVHIHHDIRLEAVGRPWARLPYVVLPRTRCQTWRCR